MHCAVRLFVLRLRKVKRRLVMRCFARYFGAGSCPDGSSGVSLGKVLQGKALLGVAMQSEVSSSEARHARPRFGSSSRAVACCRSVLLSGACHGRAKFGAVVLGIADRGVVWPCEVR